VSKDPKTVILEMIRRKGREAAAGDREAAALLLEIAKQSTMVLTSLAHGWKGAAGADALKELAAEQTSWPMTYYASREARALKENDQEAIARLLELGSATVWNFKGTTRPREVDPDEPAGWAAWIIGKMHAEGERVTVTRALRYISEHPEIVIPKKLKERAESESGKQSAEGAMFTLLDRAISSWMQGPEPPARI
jgi:hypothetical protein